MISIYAKLFLYFVFLALLVLQAMGGGSEDNYDEFEYLEPAEGRWEGIKLHTDNRILLRPATRLASALGFQ